MSVVDFFTYARARHEIYLRRWKGLPRSEWTNDPVLQTYRFCNVFRELDKTTIWFRENVRDELAHTPDVLLAIVVFRWFNRIETGEAIFNQLALFAKQFPQSAWEKFRETQLTDELKAAILNICGKGPYTTGSYIIKTPDGMNKLDGVLWCVEQFMKEENPIGRFDDAADPGVLGWKEVAQTCLDHRGTISLESVWDWLRQFPFLGDFMAYEIITDLRHTDLLRNATDILTWANPGPGAMRGLNRIHGRPLSFKQPKAKFIKEMQDLLPASRQEEHWPQAWPAWEMREVEHTLCEFDKYERTRTGEGRPRGVFK